MGRVVRGFKILGMVLLTWGRSRGWMEVGDYCICMALERDFGGIGYRGTEVLGDGGNGGWRNRWEIGVAC